MERAIHTRLTATASRPAHVRRVTGEEGYQLGRLGITIDGDGPCVSYLRGELSPIRATVDLSARHISFEFVEALPPLDRYTRVHPLRITDGGYRAVHNQLTYDVRGEATDLRVSVRSDPPGWRRRLAPEWALRMRHWNHLAPDEVHAKSFLYCVFDYLTHVAQLHLGQSYLHASSVERDGEGTAFVAWSGVGKTAVALELVGEHDFRYLSDDLGLVDDSGTLWRTPKRLQVCAYHVAGQERLVRSLLAGRSLADRASWVWRSWRRGESEVRRRVSAEELFGAHAVGRSARVTRIYCLERVDCRAFEVHPITTAELCRRAAQMVLQEIDPFQSLSRAMHGAHCSPVLPSIEDVMWQTHVVLERALHGVPAWSVHIPLAATPHDLADYCRRLLT